MTPVERVKAICKDRNIPISRLEKDLGFANAYISQIRSGTFRADRLDKIARYLDVTPQFLLYGEESLKDVYEFERQKSEEEKKPAGSEADELMEDLQLLRDRPDLRALLHAGKRITPETVRKLREFVESMGGE